MTTNPYTAAGVNIDAANEVEDLIAPLAKSTARVGADGALGGFAGLFDLKACGYQDPVLVATTDGVGTKVKIAAETACYDTVGIDLVAMCVNDLLAEGAEPLFFLDYIALTPLIPSMAASLVAGIAAGCREAGCALIGGETAEMPGVYRSNEFDLAGFAVGAVERSQRLSRASTRAGDVLLGIGSSGLHSNGFALVRKVVSDMELDYSNPAPFAAAQNLGTALLTPTRIYVKSVLPLLKKFAVRGVAHITGGGIVENLPRVLPDHLAADITIGSWPVPPVFSWLAASGGIAPAAMLRSFNNGLGLIMVVDADEASAITQALQAAGEKVYPLGQIVPRRDPATPVHFTALPDNWPQAA